MTLDEIRELIKIVSETGIAELEVQRADNRVRIRRTLVGEPVAPMPLPVYHAPAPPTLPMAISKESSAPLPAAPAPTPAPPAVDLILVKSPIVGTFYESSSPGTPAFVQIGEEVSPGKVLCIIESMKLMNEIEAEVAGIVERKLIANGKPVEYGEALFAIRPF